MSQVEFNIKLVNNGSIDLFLSRESNLGKDKFTVFPGRWLTLKTASNLLPIIIELKKENEEGDIIYSKSFDSDDLTMQCNLIQHEITWNNNSFEETTACIDS